jgi:hypothetical protein
MRRDSPWNKPSWTCKLPQTGHWLRSALRQGAWGLDDSAQECVWGGSWGFVVLRSWEQKQYSDSDRLDCRPVTGCASAPAVSACHAKNAETSPTAGPLSEPWSTSLRAQQYNKSSRLTPNFRRTAKIASSAQSLPRTATLIKGSQPQIGIDIHFRRITAFVHLRW